MKKVEFDPDVNSPPAHHYFTSRTSGQSCQGEFERNRNFAPTTNLISTSTHRARRRVHWAVEKGNG